MEKGWLKHSEIKVWLVRSNLLPIGIASFELNTIQKNIVDEMIAGQPVSITLKNKFKPN